MREASEVSGYLVAVIAGTYTPAAGASLPYGPTS